MERRAKCPIAILLHHYLTLIVKRGLTTALLMAMLLPTLIFLTYRVYREPSSIPFADMASVLVPRPDQESPENDTTCSHDLERIPTTYHLEHAINVTDDQLSDLASAVSPGGSWSPHNCRSKYRVNIIVPYRNRSGQLKTFIHYAHRFLQRQQIDYTIVIVQQVDDREFNRAKLFNVGFTMSQRSRPADCYIFHDVDLIPANLNNMYACSTQPRHMSASIDAFDYKLPYEQLFGGAVALSAGQFEAANGYSNEFFGWGGEDDDFYERVTSFAGLRVTRFEAQLSRYVMLSHAKEVPNPNRFQILSRGRYRYAVDGLSDLKFQRAQIHLMPLYTRIDVEL